MRKYLIPFTAAAAIGAAAVAAQPAGRTSDPNAKLAEATAGLTPGKPVDCIDTRRGQVNLTAAGDKLIYRFSRKLVYVSDTAGGCQGVARGDALVTRQFQTRLCRGDIAQTVDFVARMPTGGCAIGPFTPYTAG